MNSFEYTTKKHFHGIFFQDFGLDVEAFQQMVGDCPPDFLELAIACCNVRNTHLEKPN